MPEPVNNAWLMKPITKFKVQELVEIHTHLQSIGMLPDDDGDTPTHRAALVKDIEQGRSNYWDSQQNASRSRKVATANQTTGGGSKVRGITAKECNEWLETLPPWPLYPEKCGCPACKEAAHA